MKKIAVVTATRAEYGLLSPVIKGLRKHENDDLRIELIVTGTHLSESYGLTIKEIDDRIDHQIPISVKSDSEADISANQAETLIKFTELFLNEHYHAVILLGDRYETLAIAIAAGNTRTPVFHLCGGDTTEGALDEWIRHSITKISYLHFVTNDVSRRRVIQLGEDPSRVFNYGSTSIDNILTVADMNKECIYLNMPFLDYLKFKWKRRKSRKNLRYFGPIRSRRLDNECKTSIYLIMDFVAERMDITHDLFKEINDAYYGWIE